MTLDPAMLLYTYISRFSVTHHHQQREKILQSCYHKFYLPTAFHSAFQLLAQTPHVRFHGQKWVHARLCSKDRTQAFTGRNMGHFGWGWYHYPRTVSHVSETLRGRGLERQTLPLLGLGWMCSPKTQKACGTAMRLCASLFRRRRGPAGLRDLFSFLSKLRFSHSVLRAFRVCET